jgi:hypothetical protein
MPLRRSLRSLPLTLTAAFATALLAMTACDPSPTGNEPQEGDPSQNEPPRVIGDENGNGFPDKDEGKCFGLEGVVECEPGQPPDIPIGTPVDGDDDGNVNPDQPTPGGNDGSNPPNNPGGNPPTTTPPVVTPPVVTPPNAPPPDPRPNPPRDGNQQRTQTFEPTRVKPEILLIVDKSGSMVDEAVGFAGRKWNVARDVLVNILQGPIGDQHPFKMLPFPLTPRQGCTEGRPEDVAVGVDAIIDRLDATNIPQDVNNAADDEVGGGTPTAKTLVNARRLLDQRADLSRPAVAILVTDGGPNCANIRPCAGRCTSPGVAAAQCQPDQCLDDDDTVDAAKTFQAGNRKYPLFVIGVPGVENFTDVLNRMAKEGGTADAAGNALAANSGAELQRQIEAIATSTGLCRLALQNNPVADRITVTIGVNEVIENDAVNGWRIVANNTLELAGRACAAAQTKSVRVTYAF